jgi:hypothetical protein
MISITQIDNNNYDQLREFIKSSGFLTAETITYVANDNPIIYSSGLPNSLTIRDMSENILFRIEQPTGSPSYERHALYASDSLNVATGQGDQSTVQEAIACSNGVIIHMKRSNSHYSIVLTRTNTGDLAVIASVFGDSRSNTDDIYCVTWSDESPLRSINLKTCVKDQTLVAPLLTSSAFDTISYTPKAGWMPYNNDYSYNLRAIIINGHRFITDGTFAIEDD